MLFNLKILITWQKRTLFPEFKKIKSYSLPRIHEVPESQTEYIHYGDIHTGLPGFVENDTPLPHIHNGDYVLLKKNDLVVADASEDYLELAKPVVIDTDQRNIVAGLHTIALRSATVFSPFMYFYLNTKSFRHFAYRSGTGLKVFGISAATLGKFVFFKPKVSEQKKIVNMLRSFDNLIAVNQHRWQ